MSAKPWIALHRRISANLQKCHPYTRAMAWEILRHTDDDGRIPLEGQSPVDCLLRLMGGDRRMRNALPGDLAELMRIEMIVVDAEALVFPGYAKHQPGGRKPRGKATSVEPQSYGSPATVEPQSDAGRAAVEPQSSRSRAPVEPQTAPKSTELLNTGPGEKRREEERREREESRARPSPTRGLSLVEPHNYGDGIRLREWLRMGVARGYEQLGDPAPDETRDMLWDGWARLERWVVDKARLSQRDERETGRHLIRCFLRSAEARRRGYPVSFLVQNAREYWRDALPAEVA